MSFGIKGKIDDIHHSSRIMKISNLLLLLLSPTIQTAQESAPDAELPKAPKKT